MPRHQSSKFIIIVAKQFDFELKFNFAVCLGSKFWNSQISIDYFAINLLYSQLNSRMRFIIIFFSTKFIQYFFLGWKHMVMDGNGCINKIFCHFTRVCKYGNRKEKNSRKKKKQRITSERMIRKEHQRFKVCSGYAFALCPIPHVPSSKRLVTANLHIN